METVISPLSQKIRLDSKLNFRYEFLQLIGSGSFGTVYKVINRTTKHCVALKLEVIEDTTVQIQRSSLFKQISILQKLGQIQGVPKLYHAGRWLFGIFMQMELLTSSLHDERFKKYSLAEIKAMGAQLISILKKIHEKGIVHQDLKPQNIMRNMNGNLILIDFGLSLSLSCDVKKHEKLDFIGTPRYASLASHSGISQTPKDDIQSLLYVLGTLLMKRAPWFQLKTSFDERLAMIAKYKRLTNKDWFRNCGKPFIQIYEHLESLQHFESLDYELILSHFQYHRQSLTLTKKTKKSKRRMSEMTGVPGSPFIHIHYADNIENSSQNLLDNDQKDFNRSHSMFSKLAQNGMQMLQLLTNNLLKSEIAKSLTQEIDEALATVIDCPEPRICDPCKFVNLLFKNPFYV